MKLDKDFIIKIVRENFKKKCDDEIEIVKRMSPFQYIQWLSDYYNNRVISLLYKDGIFNEDYFDSHKDAVIQNLLESIENLEKIYE